MPSNAQCLRGDRRYGKKSAEERDTNLISQRPDLILLDASVDVPANIVCPYNVLTVYHNILFTKQADDQWQSSGRSGYFQKLLVGTPIVALSGQKFCAGVARLS